VAVEKVRLEEEKSMSQLRNALAAVVVLVPAITLAAPPNASLKGDPKVLIKDSAARQEQLKRAFESFRQKLAVMAGRLEASDSEKDRDRASALRKALKLAGARGVEYKFDTLIRGLKVKGADKDLDLLGQMVRENKELRQDLQALIALLTEDGRDKRLADRAKDAAQLLEKLKDLRNKQARLQALAERGKHDAKEMQKAQEKLTKQTRAVLSPPDGASRPKGEEKAVDLVREPVEEAVRAQEKAEKQLGKSDADGASESQGRAVGRLDEAIRRLEDILRQTRKEERERTLGNLLARCKRMLAFQKDILDGTEQIVREMRKSGAAQPSLAQSARANKLADKQYASLLEAEAALKLVKAEGSAVAFAEVLEQVRGDMTTVKERLSRSDVSRVTQAIETDLVETIEEIIKALEKEIRESEQPPPGPDYFPEPGKPKLVSALQQLKMILAMQRRVHNRTELYGKRYKGEQAPPPATASNDKERQKLERIDKELRDLAGRQGRLGKITREVGEPTMAQ
jgi:hypothetical protein